MKFKELSFSYDKSGDVLYMTIGKPREAISIEEPEDILVRIDPKTKEVVGLTILNFSKHFAGGRTGKLEAAPIPLKACFLIPKREKQKINF
ncbi:MAG: DUF2283 domain-containing protein [Candidatus Margulisiibacteriota bacterium]